MRFLSEGSYRLQGEQPGATCAQRRGRRCLRLSLCSGGTRWQCGSSAALGRQPWGSPGGGYPMAPPEHHRASLRAPRIPPRNPQDLRRSAGQNEERNAALSCASNTCFSSQIRCYPSPEMKAVASQQGPSVLPRTRDPVEGSSISLPSLTCYCWDPAWGTKPHLQAAHVPALHLCPSCHQATYLQLCRQCWGSPAWAPPGTATTSCLLQMFCPERVNISFPEPRITFLRVGFWTFY